MSLQLDHLVINNHFMLDECVALFQHLGFTLTPKSYHSLGSVNALMVFQDSYIELIGLPQNASPVRRELLDSPPGLDGLVFASSDAQETARQLRENGFNANPPQHFSRQVVCGNQQGEARFSAVRLVPGSFSAGRVYFCQHHTPEWIWRQPWIQPGHIQRLTVVAREPALTAHPYTRLGQTSLLDIISYPQWQDKQGDLLPLADDRDSRFAAITFSGIALEPIAQAAARLALPHCQSEGQLRVALPDLALILEFNDE